MNSANFSTQLLEQRRRTSSNDAGRRGTANKRLCRFLTWFWFSLENRESRWPTHVVYIYTAFDFLVEGSGSRRHVWLRGVDCFGFEIDRMLFRHIGHWLERFAWFRKWNQRRCDCGHALTHNKYHDSIEGTLCESYAICAKCARPAYEFSYGHTNVYWSTPWERLEVKMFSTPEGRVKKWHDH